MQVSRSLSKYISYPCKPKKNPIHIIGPSTIGIHSLIIYIADYFTFAFRPGAALNGQTIMTTGMWCKQQIELHCLQDMSRLCIHLHIYAIGPGSRRRTPVLARHGYCMIVIKLIPFRLTVMNGILFHLNTEYFRCCCRWFCCFHIL